MIRATVQLCVRYIKSLWLEMAAAVSVCVCASIEPEFEISLYLFLFYLRSDNKNGSLNFLPFHFNFVVAHIS